MRRPLHCSRAEMMGCVGYKEPLGLEDEAWIYFAKTHSDGFNGFAGVVWLVAAAVGSPMWHVQRLEVDWGWG